MVIVAQLVERWFVVPVAAGSSPVVHPIGFLEFPFVGIFLFQLRLL